MPLWNIVPMGIMALVLLLIALEDWATMSIKTWRSYLYEAMLFMCFVANFIVNWEAAALFMVVGACLYLVGIPATKRLMNSRGKFEWADLDKEVLVISMVSFPFISFFAFLINQLAFVLNFFWVKLSYKGKRYAPALVIYGLAWFGIATVVMALYVR